MREPPARRNALPIRASRWHAAALSAMVLAGAAAAHAQTVRTDFFVTNGTVNAQAISGTTLYVGGSFSFVGPVTGSGVPVDSTNGVELGGFPIVNGQVNAAVSDGAGGWYIGGTFTMVGGVARANLARVLADRSVSPWDPAANGTVRALALEDGTVYVGGDFTTVGGQGRNRIAAVDTVAGTPSVWNPNANGVVRAIVVTGAEVLVGGQFTSIGGMARNRIAGLFASSGLATGWNPNANSSVFALALDGGTVYVGGQFTGIGGQSRNRIAAISASTGAATGWNPNANSPVNSIAVSPSFVYIGGQFTSVGGQSRNRLAELSVSTGLASAWNPNAGSTVHSLCRRGATLYVGGDFLFVGGQERSRAAAFDLGTGLVTSWDPTAFGMVAVVAVDGPGVFVGGTFSAVGGVRRNNLAAFDRVSGAPVAWNPDAGGPVLAVCLYQGTVYAGGSFTQAGGQPRDNVAAFDTTSGGLRAWNPGADGPVTALAASGSTVYVGGVFGTAGGQARPNLAAVDVGTGIVTPWNPAPDDQVFAILPRGGTVVAGGSFTSAGGQPRASLAALDVSTGLATAWNPSPNGTVRTIEDGCDRIYIGGFFNMIGAQSRNQIAAIDPVTGLATGWNPNANGPVFDVALADGVVYVGGVLNTVGGQARNRIAALDPVTGLATPWNPNSNGTVRSVLAGGGTVFAAGSFTAFANTPSGNLAAIASDTSSPCPLITLVAPPLATGVVGTAYSQSVAAGGGTAPYCYAVTEGSLPAGLSLSPSSGQISGTPTVAGASVFTVTATDARGCRGMESYTLSVFSAPVASNVSVDGAGLCLTPAEPCASVPALYTRGESTPIRSIRVTFQLETAKLSLCTPGNPAASIHAGTWLGDFTNAILQVTDHGGGSYSLDQVLLGQPCGITTGGQLFRMDVMAVGPEGAGTITVTSVQARDCSNVPVGVGPGAAGSVNILGTPIVVSPAVLPAATAGVPYAQALGASPGTAPFSFAVTGGALPAGLTLAPGGQVSGTPTQSGAFAFTVTATDAGGCRGATACSLTVLCPAFALTPALLPDGVVGEPFSQTIGATGGLAPRTFAVTAGALPAGLTLAPGGLLSGTPSAAGPSVFTIGMTDAAGCTAAQSYTIEIFATPPVSSVAPNAAGLAISTANPCVGVPMVFTRGESTPARGFRVSFQIDPSRLALCTPGDPQASIHPGSWFAGFSNVQLQVIDEGAGSYTVDAVLLGLPCGISSGGTLFTVDLQSVDGDGHGAIAATRVRVRDCDNVAIPALAGPGDSLRILNTPIAISPATLPGAVTGLPYAQSLTAEAGLPPFTFTVSAGSLPPGITLSPAGELSGTTLSTGSFAFTASVADVAGCPGSRAYTLEVACPAIAVLPATLPDAVVGVPYDQVLSADAGTAPFTWAVTAGGLPAGLTLDPASGELAGTPLEAGNASFTVTVTDTAGCAGSESYVLEVFAEAPVSSIAADTDGLCLSAAQPCIAVPVVFTRAESAPARGVSVTFHLNPARLALCTPSDPAASIHAGTWLSGFANTYFVVTNEGGGRYTVDQAILGTPCGMTGGGTLFKIDLQAADGDGTGAITITSVTVRDCDLASIPASPGPAALLTIDNTPPAALADLVATPVPSGNGSGATIGIALQWTPPGTGTVQVYRAPFGAYPLYDAFGPVAPPDPLAVPGAPWTLVSANAAPGLVDAAAPRGFWHYVARVTNECGIASAPSNMTPGTLNYLLGDVSNGIAAGTGNNTVGMEDVTLLGAHYGIDGPTIAARGVDYLDVGPTVGGSLTGRPLPDRSIDFEDLFVFTGNFATGATAPAVAARRDRSTLAGAAEEFRLEAPSFVTAGQTVTATLRLRGQGAIQAFAARLGWNPAVVEPIGWSTGGFVEDQGGLVLAPRAGAVDAALLGLRAVGMSGEGVVATFTLRATRSGDPGLRIANVDARDASNRPVLLGQVTAVGNSAAGTRTELIGAAPNPLLGESSVTFALAEPGPVELAVFGVDGRRVRTLASGRRAAGTHHVAWDGCDERGAPVGPGVYYLQLAAGGRRFTRTIVSLR